MVTIKKKIKIMKTNKVTRKRTHIDCHTTIQGKKVILKDRTVNGWDNFLEQLCQDLTIMYEELGMREGTIVIKTKD